MGSVRTLAYTDEISGTWEVSMKQLLIALLFATIGGGGRVYAQPENAEPVKAGIAAAAKTPEAVIRSWPPVAQSAARAMIEKYGLPHQYGDDALVWNDIGSWQKTVVHRRGWPGPNDYLEQTILYEIPENMVPALRDFDRRLKVDSAKGELSARSETEPLNYLALNLADEILRGNRSPEAARTIYRKTTGLAKAGKSSPYMNGIRFSGHRFMHKTYYP
jgi:hypothetical protein